MKQTELYKGANVGVEHDGLKVVAGDDLDRVGIPVGRGLLGGQGALWMGSSDGNHMPMRYLELSVQVLVQERGQFTHADISLVRILGHLRQ